MKLWFRHPRCALPAENVILLSRDEQNGKAAAKDPKESLGVGDDDTPF